MSRSHWLFAALLCAIPPLFFATLIFSREMVELMRGEYRVILIAALMLTLVLIPIIAGYSGKVLKSLQFVMFMYFLFMILTLIALFVGNTWMHDWGRPVSAFGMLYVFVGMPLANVVLLLLIAFRSPPLPTRAA